MVVDIPIGSPPVPPGRHAAPGGWYPDPLDAALERYWDGWQWSRNTRVNEKAPPTPPSYPPQPYAPQQAFGQQQYQPYGQPQQYGQPPQQYAQYGQQYGQPAPAGSKAAFTADGVPLAGWWWRVLAILIDGLIVGVVAALISSPIYLSVFAKMGNYFNEVIAAAQQGLPAPPQPPVATFITPTENLIVIAVAVAVEAAYIIAFLRWRSATPGKLICGLRVVPVDQGRAGGRLPWNSIVPRALVWVIGGTTAVLWLLRLIDGLFPLWQPKRQALHDLAARTQVVKIR